MKIDITPVAKPRMVRSDKWAKRPAVLRYWAFADELRLKYPKPLPEAVQIAFYLPMPDSWSEKKKVLMNGKPHKQKPDLDNLVKATLDSLSKQDSNIYRIHASKWHSYQGVIEINEINGKGIEKVACG